MTTDAFRRVGGRHTQAAGNRWNVRSLPLPVKWPAARIHPAYYEPLVSFTATATSTLAMCLGVAVIASVGT